MPNRVYGQYCGFSRALEIVGERWAFLIIRDLLVGPKRFGDLQRGLPGIPSNVLTSRLKEMEEAGIVQRRAQPRPAGGVAYELTADGRELEAPVIALGRWGAKRLGEPRPDEVVTEDSIAAALLTTFRPERAGRLKANFQLHLGDITVNARIAGRACSVGRGPIEEPDLTITCGPQLRSILAREVAAADAVRQGIVQVSGDVALWPKFVEAFEI